LSRTKLTKDKQSSFFGTNDLGSCLAHKYQARLKMIANVLGYNIAALGTAVKVLQYRPIVDCPIKVLIEIGQIKETF
jgi:hypothetical protein